MIRWEEVLAFAVYGGMGLLLTLLGFKLFDWVTPGIRLEQELAEKQNVAVAIVVAAIILGVAGVVSAVALA